MQHLIFLDTETTGKDDTARLVQLCYQFEAATPVIKLYKPPVAISFEAMATHHITEEMVEKSAPFENSYEQHTLQALLINSIMVAHNAVFDIAILKREGVEVADFIDTLKVAQNLFDLPSYKLQYLRYWAHLNVEARAHDAEGDVAVLKALFKYLYKIYSDSGLEAEKIIETMKDISSKPTLLKRIGFGKHKGRKFEELPRDYMSWLRKQDNVEPDLIHTLDYYLK